MSLADGPHGGDGTRVARRLGIDPGDLLDLSASLNPLAPDCRTILGRAVEGVHRYPDDEAASEALAATMGVAAERVVLTNGGAEAIALVAAHRPAGWVEPFEFSLYRRHLRVVDRQSPRWRSDPHNPTGALAPADEAVGVRDEAFYLLATGRWTRGDADTTVVGSLTKAWALPGLRMGYVLARDAEEADAVRRLRPRWSVNGLVCRALPELLECADPERWRVGIADLRAALVDVLHRHDLEPAPSDANYLWVPAARGLRARLLTAGVLVRDGSGFGHPDAVRIAVPDEAGLARLTRALATTRPGASPP